MPNDSLDLMKKIVQEAGRRLRQVDEKIAAQDWVSANALIKKGFEVFGNCYFSPQLLDDTGMVLVMAAFNERNDPGQAVLTRRNVLKDRYTLLQEKIHRLEEEMGLHLNEESVNGEST